MQVRTTGCEPRLFFIAKISRRYRHIIGPRYKGKIFAHESDRAVATFAANRYLAQRSASNKTACSGPTEQEGIPEQLKQGEECTRDPELFAAMNTLWTSFAGTYQPCLSNTAGRELRLNATLIAVLKRRVIALV